MTPRQLFVPLFAATMLVLLAGIACGGGSENKSRTGQLTDPRNVPTSSPWQDNPPEVIVLDPNQLTPIAPEETPAATHAASQGDCTPKYKIQSGDTFSAIAERCGITTQAMKDANPDVDPGNLHVGDEVNIPSAAAQASPTQ